ncbi:MAG: hypothetical protein PHR35_17000 [Kiritimatiellae bacterium]|nr:hypothetical protein [Kiritimatiellia bacterium]
MPDSIARKINHEKGLTVMNMVRIGRWAFVVMGSFCLGALPARGVTFFTEEFSDNSPEPNMVTGTPWKVISADFTGRVTFVSANGPRLYLGTKDTNYASTNFEFWSTVTIPETTDAGVQPFFGMGGLTPVASYGEPNTPHIYLRIWPGTYRRFYTSVSGTATERYIGKPLHGTHRICLRWEAATKQAIYEIDLNYTGTFSPDYVMYVDASAVPFDSSNSRVYVGGGDGVSFDDLVVAEPSERPLLFQEDFSDDSPLPNMGLGTAFGAALTDFHDDFSITSGPPARIYLGTRRFDYALTNFEFGATVIIPPTDSASSMPFMGFGGLDAAADAAYGSPSVPNLTLMAWPTPVYKYTLQTNNIQFASVNFAASCAGTNRFRMRWDAVARKATFELDLKYEGYFFPHYSYAYSVPESFVLDATNSRLFVGGGYGLTFDDLAVTGISPPFPLYFAEDFSDDSPAPNMGMGSPYGAATHTFDDRLTITSGGTQREFLGTARQDYFDRDFIFWATATIPETTSPNATPFLGMGNIDAISAWGEPGKPNMRLALRPDYKNYYLTTNDAHAVFGSLGPSAAGTHRLRMRWNAATKVATFQVDMNYAGVFASDFTCSVNGSGVGLTGSNARLFVGGGYGVAFDDILIEKPLSGTSILVR